MDITVVIALLNEEESLPELISWIDKVMKSNKLSYEAILIDDGSTDKSWDIIEELSDKFSEIKGIKFIINYWKYAALFCGFEAAKGDIVITMDADLQDSPDEIPELHRMIKEDGFDLVSGWKRKRKDPVLSKNLPSKLFNWTARKMHGLKLHDMNCGLKAYNKNVVKNIEVYGDMHRYIPVLAKNAGFTNIGEKVVEHRARKYGVSKFGIDRFINGFLDLLTLVFMSRFGKRPMHFFGLMGTFSFFVGFVILIYLTYAKFVYLQYKMTERPLFFLGLLAVIFGSQLFLTGFLAEMVSRSSTERNNYEVDKRI